MSRVLAIPGPVHDLALQMGYVDYRRWPSIVLDFTKLTQISKTAPISLLIGIFAPDHFYLVGLGRPDPKMGDLLSYDHGKAVKSEETWLAAQIPFRTIFPGNRKHRSKLPRLGRSRLGVLRQRYRSSRRAFTATLLALRHRTKLHHTGRHG